MSEIPETRESEETNEPFSGNFEANPEDEALALLAHGGSRDARNELYMKKQATINRLGSRARRYLRRLSSLYPDPPISTEDIEHQSFIVFCKLLEEWSPESMTFSRFLIARMPGHL